MGGVGGAAQTRLKPSAFIAEPTEAARVSKRLVPGLLAKTTPSRARRNVASSRLAAFGEDASGLPRSAGTRSERPHARPAPPQSLLSVRLLSVRWRTSWSRSSRRLSRRRARPSTCDAGARSLRFATAVDRFAAPPRRSLRGDAQDRAAVPTTQRRLRSPDGAASIDKATAVDQFAAAPRPRRSIRDGVRDRPAAAVPTTRRRLGSHDGGGASIDHSAARRVDSRRRRRVDRFAAPPGIARRAAPRDRAAGGPAMSSRVDAARRPATGRGYSEGGAS